MTTVSLLWIFFVLIVPQLKAELSESCDAIIRHMQDFEEHAAVQLYGCSVFAAMSADCECSKLLFLSDHIIHIRSLVGWSVGCCRRDKCGH